ncbi:MAG: hypothetical protein KR126chlam4_01152 [Candidatus Anoxychlamydiales bacterium]|nr:hypothetical protein [Candidatus Anoxychlamydiales bacterium]HEU64549.1 Asp23/Gls24 family envelope stress response protein [Chlamydiota bacterium]
MNDNFKEMDTKEIQLPETTFSRDIETKVFQSIVFKALNKIEGIHLVSKGLIDSLLGRDAQESFSAIHIEQDQKQHSVSVKLEVNIKFGIAIPEKSDEIQSKIIEDISKYTGLHVSSVHVIFKNLLSEITKVEEEDDDDDELETIVSNEEEYEGF